MIAEIAAGVTAIARTKDLLASLKSITDHAKRDVALFEIRDQIGILQDSLAGAREKIDSLSEEKRDLKKQLAEVDEWKSEKAKYHLIEVRDGLFLYSCAPSDDDTTPAHWICPTCFAKKHISILQKPTLGIYKIRCFNCEFSFDPGDTPQNGKVEVISGFHGRSRDTGGLF